MNIEKERLRLMQKATLDELLAEPKLTDMLTVYKHDVKDSHNRGIHSILVPIDKKDDVLADFSWEMQSTDGLPSSCVYGGNRAEYLRFGNDDGYEPLLICREFCDIKPSSIEITEEFRLFHNLYHDSVNNHFIKIDESGNTTVIAIVTLNEAKIRMKELKQFLAIKEMYLSIQFDCKEYSQISLSELSLEETHNKSSSEKAVWMMGYGDIQITENRYFSRLCGKKLVEPLLKSQSGMYGFEKKKTKKYVDFIVDTSSDGDEILFSSNASQRDYLTAVYFKKEVLDKYHQKPSRYSVESSYLRCTNLWGMMIDNDQKDIVCAWLGDLGRDLPYEEQLHWRSYNIEPVGSMSSSFFRQQILAEFTDSESFEHIFKNMYRKFNETCMNILNEHLILPLKDEDSHYFDTIRVPSTNEQLDFDSLILGLTKVMIDSLNEKYLNSYLKSKLSENEFNEMKGSIKKLEKTLDLHGITDYENHISFLRNLQNLRSSSSAHRKGKGYEKAIDKFKIHSEKDLKTGFRDILKQSCEFLDYLMHKVSTESLNFSIE